jgi:hypothetical protein
MSATCYPRNSEQWICRAPLGFPVRADPVMMTRTRPVTFILKRDATAIALVILALSGAGFGAMSYAEESPPISEFLHRAQLESNARRFSQLLDSLGEKTRSSSHAKSSNSPSDDKVVQVRTTNGITPARTMATQPKLIMQPVTLQEAHPVPLKSKIRKTRSSARPSKDAWIRRASSIIRSGGVRF